MAEPQCRFRFAGRDYEAPAGSVLGAALWAAGCRELRRSPAAGAPRGMFCAMGVCFECLVVVDGTVARACMVVLRDGMQVEPL